MGMLLLKQSNGLKGNNVKVSDIRKALDEFSEDTEVAFMMYVDRGTHADGDPDIGVEYYLIDGFVECELAGQSVALAEFGKMIESI